MRVSARAHTKGARTATAVKARLSEALGSTWASCASHGSAATAFLLPPHRNQYHRCRRNPPGGRFPLLTAHGCTLRVWGCIIGIASAARRRTPRTRLSTEFDPRRHLLDSSPPGGASAVTRPSVCLPVSLAHTHLIVLRSGTPWVPDMVGNNMFYRPNVHLLLRLPGVCFMEHCRTEATGKQRISARQGWASVARWSVFACRRSWPSVPSSCFS